jgi:hypothetical protein
LSTFALVRLIVCPCTDVLELKAEQWSVCVSLPTLNNPTTINLTTNNTTTSNPTTNNPTTNNPTTNHPTTNNPTTNNTTTSNYTTNLARYKKKDPADSEELELMETLFQIQCKIIELPENCRLFVASGPLWPTPFMPLRFARVWQSCAARLCRRQ